MTQGMFSAITGIAANQTRLDVIADNIANLNTVAFKSSMVNFQSVFTRTISTGQAPVGNLGGTNPKQIGLGVLIGEMGRDFTQGNVQTTGRSTDLNIQGEGFFVLENGGAAVGPATGLVLTRAGNFTLDADGTLVNPDGLRVLGTTDITSTSALTTNYVQVPRTLNINKTVNGDGVVTAATIDTSTINGGGGNSDDDNALSTYSVNQDGSIEATYSNGDRITVTTNGATPPQREIIYFPSEGGSLTVSSGLTIANNVVEPHNLQIRFATVTNNAGLTNLGNNLWGTSANSGDPFFSIGQTGGVGLCDAGGLETSNVDLTKEFSNMMLSQRALEANSRAFDAHNSVLQTIVNLAR